MGKRHLTPAEIKEQCKRIARESRMADRTPWTAMGIICSYVIMRREGFKGQRISRLANKVNEMEADWSAGKIGMKEISQRLMDKTGWSIEYKAYTEDDITARNGSYQYWLDRQQIGPQNIINEQATRYMLFFFTALMDMRNILKSGKSVIQYATFVSNLGFSGERRKNKNGKN